MRTDTYTLSVNDDGTIDRLFNNTTDPYQMTNLSFSSLPAADQTLLREELGHWLKKANDQWYQNRIASNFIIYPD